MAEAAGGGAGEVDPEAALRTLCALADRSGGVGRPERLARLQHEVAAESPCGAGPLLPRFCTPLAVRSSACTV